MLPEEYGPQGSNAFNLHFDYGVIVFEVPPGGLVTHAGTPVDLTGVDPVALPVEGFLDFVLDPRDPPILTAVGYSVGEAHKRPGEGGNKGGAVNDASKLGVRWVATGTAAIHPLGPNRNLLFGSQNPARSNEGTCGGDSGGPLFYDDGGAEVQVAITSSGDAICRASALMARTDAPEIQGFLACVLSGTTTAEIEACGCTAVGRQGECNQ